MNSPVLSMSHLPPHLTVQLPITISKFKIHDQKAIDLDPTDKFARERLHKCRKILADPAYLKLTDSEYAKIKYAFENAYREFRFLVGRVIPYGDFLKLTLGQQIKQCHKALSQQGIGKSVMGLVLPQWLATGTRTIYAIVDY